MNPRHSMLVAALLAAAGYATPSPQRVRERDKQPRKFTDARKAEAEAKRQRKAAKRAATRARHPGDNP